MRTNKQIMVEYDQAAGRLREHKNYVKMQDKKSAAHPKRISISANNPVGTIGRNVDRVGRVKSTRSIKPKNPLEIECVRNRYILYARSFENGGTQDDI